MAEHKTNTLPVVSFECLQRQVAETKSASTARYYLAMLKRLEEYNQSSSLDLNKVNTEYVSGFGEYLLRDDITLSTVKLFKMAFRAVMKDSFGKDNRALFKAAFQYVGSTQEAVTNCISYEDLLKILKCKLEDLLVIERARLVFLYCVFSGGISLKDLQQQISTDKVDQRLPQQAMILREFEKKCNRTFEVYVSSLQEEQYSLILERIGILAGTSSVLKHHSAMDAWISAAKLANLPTEVIASILPSDYSFSKNVSLHYPLSEHDKLNALRKTANKIVDMKSRWFVMRCFGIEPEDISKRLEIMGVISAESTFSCFIPPKQKAYKSKKQVKKLLVDEMYFFSCMPTTAAAIRQAIKEFAWVYTLPGTSTPAQIFDSEMKTFMLLCDVSDGTLQYHFPNAESRDEGLIVGREAKIINGNFCGQVGVVKELHNKYRVVMEFNALSAKVTAEVPIDFIRLSQNV